MDVYKCKNMGWGENMAQNCVRCGKKINIFSEYKCKDGSFCSDCLGDLNKVILDSLACFTSDQVSDLLLLRERNDKILADDALEKLLKKRRYWISELEKNKLELNKIEKDFKKNYDNETRERNNALRKCDWEFERFKKDNKGKISAIQIQNHNEFRQTMADNYEENLKDLQELYHFDKEAMKEFYEEANENVKKTNDELNEFIKLMQQRADELKEIDNSAKIEAEENIQGELESIKEAAMERALEEARNDAKIKAANQARIEAEEKIKEELEEIKAKAEQKALEEAKAKAELLEKENATKQLEKEERERQKAQAKAERARNPTHLAIISLVCAILSWLAIITVIPAFALAVAAIVTGIRGLKSSRKKMAIAGTILGVLLIALYAAILIFAA